MRVIIQSLQFSWLYWILCSRFDLLSLGQLMVIPSALQHLTPTNTKNRTVRTKGIYLTKSHNRTCPIIALDLTDSKTCQQCANTLKEITRSCALGHPNYLSWLCSICVVMPYFRFFNNCLANWVRQGTRRLKLALKLQKSLKYPFFCSYFCSFHFCSYCYY